MSALPFAPTIVLMVPLRRSGAPGAWFALVLACVPTALFCQRVRIAELSMGGGGDSEIPYTSLAATVARFDVVAADGVRDAGGMEKVLAGIDEGWEGALSGGEGSFGFFYNERVQLVKELGVYPGKGQFARPPSGAQFRLSDTGFTFNLVVCEVTSQKDQKARAAEIIHLLDAYRYFEKLTGNRGMTILAGRFGKEHENELQSLVAGGRGDVMAVKRMGSGTVPPYSGGGRILASSALRPRIEEAGIGASSLHPAYVVLKIEKLPIPPVVHRKIAPTLTARNALEYTPQADEVAFCREASHENDQGREWYLVGQHPGIGALNPLRMPG